MVLATHMVTGAAAARLFSTNPIAAFLIGWLSHYLLDAITHWDYPLKTYSSDLDSPEGTKLVFNKDTIFDILKVLVDVALGFSLILVFNDKISPNYTKVILAGAIGGTIPDFIQFLFGAFKLKFLGHLQRFHHFMHSNKSLNNLPVIGIAIQVCIVFLAGWFI